MIFHGSMVAVILQLRFPVVPDQCQGRGTVVNGAFFPVTCHAGSPGCPSADDGAGHGMAACHMLVPRH